ncbi:MAG: M23 family metallopeptidase, partial [Treponema sp.]|nr:M23 family metallopeptidase [Treponema sp.]
ELQAIDTNIKSTYNEKLLNNNSFYFIYPPQFYSKIEECGLREINPYLNYSFAVDKYMNCQTGENDGTKIFNAITNPGFAPFLGDGKGIYGFANICTQWFNEWPNKKNGDYHHEGVDFSVGGKDFCDKIPIKALIPGTVIYSSGDQGNFSYGKYLIIKADKKYNDKYMYFLLGHISRKMDYVKEGHVSPGQIVAYVGNSGHCIGGGYDMKGKTNIKAREDGYGAHLHLTLLLRSEENAETFLKNINAVKGYPANDLWITRQKFGNVNPFNYDEKYYKRKDE